MKHVAKLVLAIATGMALVTGLSACGTVPDTITQQPNQIRPPQPAAPNPTSGSIFASSAYRPLFEDRRARLVGDVVTVAITENTSAVKGSSSSGSKTGGINVSASSLFGKTGLAGASANTDNSFAEKGAAASSNTFTGTITTTVIEVLPNGNLVVSGEKQVALDKGTEYVRFSGIVNPDRISGGVVSSTQVADARVEYRTNSRIDKSEFMSQVARFVMSLAPL